MRILVTGAAGFIGYHLTLSLLEKEYQVLGIDNLNDYYDPNLKEQRLKEISNHKKSKNFNFFKEDISNRNFVSNLFLNNSFDAVINLASQAGVRHSLSNPHAYVDSNLVGFVNILEGCRNAGLKHFIFASSSSVYGMNKKKPFSTRDRTDYPISLYAATKKSNELIAFNYSHLYDIPTTGLRFFTVYGPFGRPDMAYYKFTKAILNGKSIDVYNNGEMKRDFTYIDDIVDGILKVLNKPPIKNDNKYSFAYAKYQIFNIGNNNPVSLRDFINAIEISCKKKAIENNLPLQPGDVIETFADIDNFVKNFDFQPKVSINEGIEKFVLWYIKNHFNKDEI